MVTFSFCRIKTELYETQVDKWVASKMAHVQQCLFLRRKCSPGELHQECVLQKTHALVFFLYSLKWLFCSVTLWWVFCAIAKPSLLKWKHVFYRQLNFSSCLGRCINLYPVNFNITQPLHHVQSTWQHTGAQLYGCWLCFKKQEGQMRSWEFPLNLYKASAICSLLWQFYAIPDFFLRLKKPTENRKHHVLFCAECDVTSNSLN